MASLEGQPSPIDGQEDSNGKVGEGKKVQLHVMIELRLKGYRKIPCNARYLSKIVIFPWMIRIARLGPLTVEVMECFRTRSVNLITEFLILSSRYLEFLSCQSPSQSVRC